MLPWLYPRPSPCLRRSSPPLCAHPHPGLSVLSCHAQRLWTLLVNLSQACSLQLSSRLGPCVTGLLENGMLRKRYTVTHLLRNARVFVLVLATESVSKSSSLDFQSHRGCTRTLQLQCFSTLQALWQKSSEHDWSVLVLCSRCQLRRRVPRFLPFDERKKKTDRMRQFLEGVFPGHRETSKHRKD